MRTADVFVTLILGVAAMQGADRPKGPAREDFKDIVVYNMFDPDRGPRPEPKPAAPVKVEPPKPRVERVTLTGVLKSDNGAYGFFDGTDRDYQKVAQQGDALGVFKVTKVGIDGVELAQGTNNYSLPIRGELSHSGDDPWQISAVSGFSGSGATPSKAGGSETSGSAAAASSPADDDRRNKLLELLRKKRESAK